MKDNNLCPLHLLDYLSRETGCAYLSDLHHPKGELLSKLTESVALLPVQAASLREWNAALSYIGSMPLELTAERAKASLLAYLFSK